MYINLLACSRRQKINQYKIRESPFSPLPVCMPPPQVAPHNCFNPSPRRAITFPLGLPISELRPPSNSPHGLTSNATVFISCPRNANGSCRPAPRLRGGMYVHLNHHASRVFPERQKRPCTRQRRAARGWPRG